MSIDPRLVGGAPIEPVEAPSLKLPQAKPITQEAAAAVTGNLAGPDYAAGAAIREEQARPKATFGESFGAATASWGLFSVYDFLKRPDFEPESSETYNPQAWLNQLDISLSDQERTWLLQANSNADMGWRVGNLRRKQIMSEVMGDNPVTSLIGSAIDPTYLGLDAVSLGAARAAKLGRVAAGVGSFAGAAAVGLAEHEVTGLDLKDVALNAAVNAAAVAVTYNPITRRLEKADPDFPDAELARVAKDAETTVRWQRVMNPDGTPAVRKDGKPHYERIVEPKIANTAEALAEVKAVANETLAMPSAKQSRVVVPGETASEALSSLQDTPGIGRVAAALIERAGAQLRKIPVRVLEPEAVAAGGRATMSTGAKVESASGYYNMRTGEVVVAKNAPPEVVTHEIAHALTADKIEYGLKNKDTTHGKIVAELQQIMNRARVQAATMPDVHWKTDYFNDNLHEFVAGLFSGDTQFARTLSKMPDKSTGGSILGSLVDAVRRLLGLAPDETSALTRALKLSDDLLQTAEVPRADTPYFLHSPKGDVADSVGSFMDRWSAKELGNKVAWSLHRSLRSKATTEEGRKIIDTIWDNALNPGADTVDSQARAVRADLRAYQNAIEDAMLDEMKNRGYGWSKRMNPLTTKRALEVQNEISNEVKQELSRIQYAKSRGVPLPPKQLSPGVQKIVDAHNKAMKFAAKEMEASKVPGAEALGDSDGYFRRDWSIANMDDVSRKLVEVDGLTPDQAKQRLRSLVISGIRKANPDWDGELAHDVGNAIVNRTYAKGYGEDQPFRANFGKATAGEMRSLLSTYGVSGARLERAIEVLTGSIDEAGKVSFLKHRVNIDPNASIVHADGTATRILDLWDSNLMRSNEAYFDSAASQIAFARKGLGTSTDITKAREAYLHSIPDVTERKEAAKDFDNGIKVLQGYPVGEDMHRLWRMGQAVGRAITLGYSSLWQLTEYPVMVMKYGAVKTTKYMFANMPGARQLFDAVGKDKGAATHLVNMLSRNSAQEIRMRPFIQRFEDNYELPANDVWQAAMSQVEQAVPIVNAMKFVIRHQAQVAANLVVDTVDRAIRGDARAIAELERYGLKGHLVEQVKPDLLKSLNSDDWADSTWQILRGPLTKMMDEDVLRARSGEIPAFAQHSSLGKFLVAYRSFTLAAHNKVLANTLGHEGYAGIALLAAYQYPLTVLATAANNTLQGKQPMETDELLTKSVGQMGMLGLGVEIANIALGENNRMTLPGTIVFDRVFGVASAAMQGDAGKTAEAVRDIVPLLAITPGNKLLDSLDK